MLDSLWSCIGTVDKNVHLNIGGNSEIMCSRVHMVGLGKVDAICSVTSSSQATMDAVVSCVTFRYYMVTMVEEWLTIEVFHLTSHVHVYA